MALLLPKDFSLFYHIVLKKSMDAPPFAKIQGKPPFTALFQKKHKQKT
jgi:hypothetical protein